MVTRRQSRQIVIAAKAKKAAEAKAAKAKATKAKMKSKKKQNQEKKTEATSQAKTTTSQATTMQVTTKKAPTAATNQAEKATRSQATKTQVRNKKPPTTPMQAPKKKAPATPKSSQRKMPETPGSPEPHKRIFEVISYDAGFTETKYNKWRNIFKDKKSLSKEIEKRFEQKTPHYKFNNTFAELLLNATNATTFHLGHGTTYRWKKVSVRHLDSDEIDIGIPDNNLELISEVARLTNENAGGLVNNKKVGAKYVLELFGEDGWYEWISIRQSKYKSAKYAVYAERQFYKNCLIGAFIGETIEVLTDAKAKRPAPTMEQKKLKRASIHLDREARWVLSVPQLLEGKEEEESRSKLTLSMAMHLMRDPTDVYNENTADYERAKTVTPNAYLLQEGWVAARKNIMKDDEITCYFGLDDNN